MANSTVKIAPVKDGPIQKRSEHAGNHDARETADSTLCKRSIACFAVHEAVAKHKSAATTSYDCMTTEGKNAKTKWAITYLRLGRSIDCAPQNKKCGHRKFASNKDAEGGASEEGAEERALFQGASCSSGGGGWTVVVAHHEPVVAQHNETHDAAHAVKVHA